MSHPSTSSGQVSADWQGLAQLPQLFADVQVGVLTLKTLITTPAAAVSTGSPPASGAIVLLGAELAMFLAQTVQAIEDDIAGLLGVRRNYEQNEAEIAAECNRGHDVIEASGGCPAPHTGGPTGGRHPAQLPPSSPSPSPMPSMPGQPMPGQPTTGMPEWPGGGYPGTPPFVPPSVPATGGSGMPGWPGGGYPGSPGTLPSVPPTGGGDPGRPQGGYPGVPQPGAPSLPGAPQPEPMPCPTGEHGNPPPPPEPCPTGEHTPTAPPPEPAAPVPCPGGDTSPSAPAPSGDFAVDPSRRDDLLSAGGLALDGLVDLVSSVGEQIECPTPGGR